MVERSALRKIGCAVSRSAIFATIHACLVAPNHAADIRWRLPAGGTFNSNGSWTGGVAPGAGDNAQFGLTVPPPPLQLPDVKTYSVAFTDDPSTASLTVEDDLVTFNLNGHTYSLASGSVSSQIGNVSGQGGSLIIKGGLVDGFNNQGIVVGVNGGHGGLVVNSLGRLRTLFGTLGSSGSSTGVGTVSGAGSEWDAGASLNVGAFGASGALEVLAGGRVVSNTGVVGTFPGTSSVDVEGAGSEWSLSGNLLIGDTGPATANITSGGSLSSSSGTIGRTPGANGSVTIDGPSSSWVNAAGMVIGLSGTGALSITGGAGVINRATFLGQQPSGSGSAIVNGAGSLWSILGTLGVGVTDAFAEGGQGTLRIQSGGSVVASGETYIGANDAVHLEGGELSTTQVKFVGANKPFFWTSGKLRDVRRFESSMTVPAGGILEPVHGSGGGSLVGTQIIGGYDQQAAGSTLAVDIGGAIPTAHDLVNVGGPATLGGNLQVTLTSGFTPSDTNTFQILEALGDITSSFANAANGERLAVTGGFGSFRVNYGPQTAFGPPAGNKVFLDQYQPGADFNGDRAVNAADLAIWTAGFGATAGAAHSQGDANNDGVVDGADLLTWQQQSGWSFQVSATVATPEPGAAIILGIAMASLVLRNALNSGERRR